MGFFHDDKDGNRRALVRTTAAEVAKQTSAFTEAAAAVLKHRPVEGVLSAWRRKITRNAQSADLEAGVRDSVSISAIQDNINHMQTGYARTVNDIKRLHNETVRLDLDLMELEREADQIERQNAADATTADTLMKASRLEAEITLLETRAKAVRAALALGIDPTYLYEDNFGVDLEKAIPVIQVERERTDKMRERHQAEARATYERITAERERVREAKNLDEERKTPNGMSDSKLYAQAERIANEASIGHVFPDTEDRYFNPLAGATYIHELIMGSSKLDALKHTTDTVFRALKQHVTGFRKATRATAQSELETYNERKAEYDRLVKEGTLVDLVQTVAGGAGNAADPIQ